MALTAILFGVFKFLLGSGISTMAELAKGAAEANARPPVAKIDDIRIIRAQELLLAQKSVVEIEDLQIHGSALPGEFVGQVKKMAENGQDMFNG